MAESAQLWSEGIDAAASEYLKSQIESDEKVLWSGTTDVAGRRKRLIPVVISCLFMLLLCSGFMALNNPSPWLPIGLAVVVFLGIPIFVVWRQTDHLKRTLYALTDKRALMLSVGKPKRTESYPPEKIEILETVGRPGGRGDLFFTKLRGRAAGAPGRRTSYKHGFLSIRDVKQVAALMRATFPDAPINK